MFSQYFRFAMAYYVNHHFDEGTTAKQMAMVVQFVSKIDIESICHGESRFSVGSEVILMAAGWK